MDCCCIIHLVFIGQTKINIFVLSQNPFEAAADHCDKHVVKMILEYGQMLSTAHRLLDGKRTEFIKPDGKKQVVHLMPGEVAILVTKTISGDPKNPNKKRVNPYSYVINEKVIYGVAHANHPCSVWARQTDANYYWLYQLFVATLQEYTRRYEKVHQAQRLVEFLSRAPKNIPRGQQAPFAQAMPEEYKHEDAVEAYRRFYVGAKARFAKWKNTPVPNWFKHRMEG